MEVDPHVREFQRQHTRLFGMAYRMLGSVTDSEDVLQDAYIRWSKTRMTSVRTPAAYLSSVVSRLCVDKLRRRKIEKLNYPGPWLPEPLPTDPESELEQAQSLNTAFLLMLEKMNPQERAVFVLREAFDFSHQEIGEMLTVSAAHSRQLLRRARQRVDGDEIVANDDSVVSLVESFFAAARLGEMSTLQKILCEDVVAYSDGGGRASAAIIPLVGVDRVATVFSHLVRNNEPAFEVRWQRINNQQGMLLYEGDQLSSVTTFVLRLGKIQRIYVMRNPAKLGAFTEP